MIEELVRPFDLRDPALAAAYDDLPLWSAPFGLALLDRVRLKAGMTFLDLGCGTGFPLLELAARLGPSCRAFGLDPWPAALDRARSKAQERDLPQVALLEGEGEAVPLPDVCCDAVVSNNGLNNVRDMGAALRECARVLRPGGQLVCTLNLPGTMREFYAVLAGVMTTEGICMETTIAEHVRRKRPSLSGVLKHLTDAGFTVRDVAEHGFLLRTANGSALLRHFFVRLAFLGPWLEILPAVARDRVFLLVEERLNELAARNGELALRVPFACIDAECARQ